MEDTAGGCTLNGKGAGEDKSEPLSKHSLLGTRSRARLALYPTCLEKWNNLKSIYLSCLPFVVPMECSL